MCEVCKQLLQAMHTLNNLRFCSRTCLEEWMRENPKKVR